MKAKVKTTLGNHIMDHNIGTIGMRGANVCHNRSCMRHKQQGMIGKISHLWPYKNQTYMRFDKVQHVHEMKFTNFLFFIVAFMAYEWECEIIFDIFIVH